MNDKRSDLKLVAKFHDEGIRRWGVADTRAIGYSDKAPQLARFEVISALYECGESVLDAGCGTGDLFAYLRRLGGEVEYLGLEQQEEFVRYADMTYGACVGCEFRCGDFTEEDLGRKDFVVACGSLSYRRVDPQSYRASIERLFAAANSLLVFNMLDVTRMFPGEAIIGHDPDAIARECKLICDSVWVVRGYLPHDFTIAMARESTCEMRLERLSRMLPVSRM